MNLLSMFAASRMGACLGCSLWLPEGIMGDGAATEGFTMVTGNPDPGHDAFDFTNSKLVIFFGCNIADNITPSVRFLTQAKEAGARIVVIDPRMSSTASIADEWIPINPGTDTALILSMMNVIIANGLHDETWLKNYSCGPLLVSDADGKYVRNAEGEILAWDTAANAAVAVGASAGEDDQTSGPESTLALTGNFTVNGVACHPSFEDLCAEVAEWTPEKASEITGIPAAKIEELALVIDTSYSTSGALVRAFLAETYTLLKGQENFFHRMNLHLIQADNAIRQDLLIRNEDELIHAMNHFELRGGGGTDFRPAFAYVDRLCAEKKFSNLRGLLYFTDGMGTYPAKRPAYDTAFLFLGERFDDANVPPWAMKVVLDEEEFTGAAARPASALADALAEEDDLYRDLNNS